MNALNLKVKQRRKCELTTNSKYQLPAIENVLNNRFSPTALNRIWGPDITYLWTQEGWIYLAVVIALYSRRVVGWVMGRRMKKADGQGLDDGDQSQGASAMAGLSFGSWWPVCQLCLPGLAKTAWDDRELGLGSRSGLKKV